MELGGKAARPGANGASSGTYHDRTTRCRARQAYHGLPLFCPGKNKDKVCRTQRMVGLQSIVIALVRSL